MFGDGGGADEIVDFEDGLDLIELHAIPGVGGFATLTITAVGGGSLVSWGTADSVMMAYAPPASLTAADFLFT